VRVGLHVKVIGGARRVSSKPLARRTLRVSG
jgi:hypothetical protein